MHPQVILSREDTTTVSLFKDKIDKVRQIPRSRALKTSTKKESNRIPFVVTLNPALPNLRQVISSNLNILRSSQRCQTAFPSPPLISYRRCNNLRDILVRAKHRRPPPPPPWHRDLSVVTKKGVKRAVLLKKKPRLTLSSLLTSKKVYGITSPALLLTSCT